jgi:hypothetical protein
LKKNTFSGHQNEQVMATSKRKKHQPIKYKKAIINFTYSFSWDVTMCDFDDIAESANAVDVKEGADIVNEKWLNLYLFNRPVSWAKKENQASYHPNIISQNLLVLHRKGIISEDAEIVIPVNKDHNSNFKDAVEYKKLNAQLNYAVRIYENGSGNCTFSFILNKNVNLENIHNVLHLASSVSYIEEDLLNVQHLTFSWLNGRNLKIDKKLHNKDKIYLSDLFSNIIESKIFPPIWKQKKLWFDSKVIKGNGDDYRNWQSPFVLTFLETDKKDFEDFEQWQRPEHLKEIGSIACRFSLDNSKIVNDSYKLKREYIFSSFGAYQCSIDETKRSGIRLKNYSHHSDLFYTIGKRGAIALSPDFASNPSYFVLPTFLNLVEILRSRWHLGSIVNLKLDELLEKISHTKNIDELQDKIFRCKVLYGLFLKNPAPYLFDGGAITDIAEAGEEIFWLERLSIEMEKKFLVMDKLVDDIYSRKRIKEIFG